MKLRGISKSFGGRSVLSSVDLEIGGGELLSILGPSGCGKSTLLRIISGLETPDTGSVEILGRDMTNEPPSRRPVNTVFQSYALFPNLTVSANVAFGLTMRGVPKPEIERRVSAVLDLMRIAELRDRKPGQLSGGQQQRVAVARAIVNEPALVLLDEPLAALDRFLRRSLQEELRELQRRLCSTFVFVTHDQEEAFAMSDRVAVMNCGALQQVGSPSEIYDRPSNRFVAEFIGESTLLDGIVVAADGTELAVETPLGVLTVSAGGTAPRAGDRVHAMIRPEHIRPVRSGSRNVLSGTVEEVRLRGSAADISLRVNGVKLMARATPSDARALDLTVSHSWMVPAEEIHLIGMQ